MAESQDPQPERISEAEHAVMEALWEKSPLAASEVCEAVCEERDWSMPTVKTLLSRLVDRLFGGRAAPLLLHLVEAEALSEADIDEIERLIRELRK